MCPVDDVVTDPFVTFADDSEYNSEETQSEEYFERLPPKKKRPVELSTDKKLSSNSRTIFSDVAFLKDAYWATGAFLLVALVILVVAVVVARGKSELPFCSLACHLSRIFSFSCSSPGQH